MDGSAYQRDVITQLDLQNLISLNYLYKIEIKRIIIGFLIGLNFAVINNGVIRSIMKKLLLLLLMTVLFSPVMSAKNLKGVKLDFVYTDTVFKNPFIDVDKTIRTPVLCRYIHGGSVS